MSESTLEWYDGDKNLIATRPIRFTDEQREAIESFTDKKEAALFIAKIIEDQIN